MSIRSIQEIPNKHWMTFFVQIDVWFSSRKFSFDHRNLRKISSNAQLNFAKDSSFRIFTWELFLLKILQNWHLTAITCFLMPEINMESICTRPLWIFAATHNESVIQSSVQKTLQTYTCDFDYLMCVSHRLLSNFRLSIPAPWTTYLWST